MVKRVRIPAKTFRKDVKRGKGVKMKTVHRKSYTRRVVTPETMPSRRFPKMTETQIKKALTKAGKRYVPVGGYVWIDVGRPAHHYVLAKKTKVGWKKVKTVDARKGKPHPVGLTGRRKWMGMSHAKRMRLAPSRKGRAGYTKKTVMRTHPITGTKFKTHIWVKKK